MRRTEYITTLQVSKEQLMDIRTLNRTARHVLVKQLDDESEILQLLGNLSSIVTVVSVAVSLGTTAAIASALAGILAGCDVSDRDMLTDCLEAGAIALDDFIKNHYNNSWDMVEIEVPMIAFPDYNLRTIFGPFNTNPSRVYINGAWIS